MAESNFVESGGRGRSLLGQMGETPQIPRGRGAGTNPRNRFEATEIVVDLDAELPEEERPAPRTRFYDDASESAVTFYEFALYFRDQLAVRNALFLDGTVSEIFVPELNRHGIGWFGPIVGVVQR